MDSMLKGIWKAGILELKSAGEVAAFLLLLAGMIGLGYFLSEKMGNPLRWVGVNRFCLLAALIVLSIPVTIQMQSKELQKIAASPHGIVSLELAKTSEKAEAIRAAWKATYLPIDIDNEKVKKVNALEQAKKEIYFDAPFLVLYSLFFMLVMFWIAEHHTGRVQSVALTLGWAAPIAGVFDAVENYAMLQILNEDSATWFAPLAFWCALLKLFLTLVVFGVFLIVVFGMFLRAVGPRPPA